MSALQAMQVELPGGRVSDGVIERQANFRVLNGHVELALLEADVNANTADYVTTVLACALDSVGSVPADAQNLSSLCMADRQFLMLRLAALLHGEHMWLKVTCNRCAAPFDVEVRRCDLPLKAAGAGFPLARVNTGGSTVQVRVPTGADQGHIAGYSDDEALHQLLQRCIRSVDGQPPQPGYSQQLSQQDIDAIDAALDDVSPAVCAHLLVTCPECAREQRAKLDHYHLSGSGDQLFYDEVHCLASHYHWSEAEILDLPLGRRRLYLDLINRFPGKGGEV